MTRGSDPLLTEVQAAIAERSRHFMDRYAAADARGLVEGYFAADDAGPLASPPGGQPLVRGRSALITMFGGMFADVPGIRIETLHIEASGALAHELGRAHLTTRAGDTVLGRYTVLWRKGPDGWRAKIDFFAADGWSD